MTKKRNTAETIFFDLSHALGLLEDVVADDDTVETLCQASESLERARDTMAAGPLEVFSQAEEILKTMRRIHSMTTTDIEKMTPGDAVAMIPLIANMVSKTLYPIYEPIYAIIDQPADPEFWYIVSRTRDEAVQRGQTRALTMLAFHLTAVAVREGVDLRNAELLSAISSSEKMHKLFPFPE